MRFRSCLLVSVLLGASAAASAEHYVTGSQGNGQAFSNYQPSLVLTQSLATSGPFPPRDGTATAQYLGMIHSFAGNYTAFGMPNADGQLKPISQNTALFSILGTNYGGDGKSTFGLPNLVGRVAIGTGQGPGLEDFVVGQEAGIADVTLTQANMPAHAHQFAPGEFTSITGGNMPFDNYQPSLAMTYMIATQGIFRPLIAVAASIR
jgi:microcystin-dependent protein